MTGYTIEVPGDAADSLRLRRHRTLTLRCLGPGANVSMLLYALEDRTERLNVPDTLKAQMSARVAAPMALMSDMGRALASVTGSSLDWHDAITGHGLSGLGGGGVGVGAGGGVAVGAGGGGARRGLLDELAKHGLDRRDLHATVNFFSKVAPVGDARGTLVYEPGHADEGDWVTLRAEIDLLVVLSTAPHPLAPAASGSASAGASGSVPGVRLEIDESPAPGAEDATRRFRAESARALELAERSHA
ncbi:DUF1989 domain-containing protein [Actinospica durhamensis]|uniref:DUF1989 domain-containing protein n=1 Tax=Actinospica durhamensis TaxID=1508375 RepID=A0A941ENQ2_9ACTN|nr:DUF1989 domain-containing protein [Actinospica durhamensis]MBR7834411.1 DUF1989 domain-containing protein [Actinospica durhamensis]